jgi:hypothetical protein
MAGGDRNPAAWNAADLFQINARIPPGTPSGHAEVVAANGDVIDRRGVTVAVRGVLCAGDIRALPLIPGAIRPRRPTAHKCR